MNKYEGMFLLDHGKVKSEAQKGIEEVTRLIEKCGGRMVEVGRWDERRLAYEINDQKRGIYVLAHFELAPSQITELNREFNLNEIVSRHLVTRIEADFPEFLNAQDLEARFGSHEYRDRGRRGPGREGGRRSDDESSDEESSMARSGSDR
ncbi:MAG: 30S ribosomal protein S6 [Planctomycetota bacterium]